MCGGKIVRGVGRVVRGAVRESLDIGDTLTGGLVGDLLNPKMPALPTAEERPQAPLASAQQAQVDDAALAAGRRERLRAARRFGRASTIAAGTVGAPTGAGKTAIGS